MDSGTVMSPVPAPTALYEAKIGVVVGRHWVEKG